MNKFKKGDKVKITANTCFHSCRIGEIVTIKGKFKSCVKPEAYSIEEHTGFITPEDCELISAVPESDRKIVILPEGNKTIARLYEGKKVIKTAEVSCYHKDTYDFNIGALKALEKLVDVPVYEHIKPEVREVKRPAKLHEFVKITSKWEGVTVGEICEVIHDPGFASNNIYIRTKHPTCFGYSEISPCTMIDPEKYVVLENYTPTEKMAEDKPEKKEPEKPNYYNGKVVCIDANDSCFFTTGMVYEVIDGKLKCNYGIYNPSSEFIQTFSNIADYHWVPRFIEYKGEQK